MEFRVVYISGSPRRKSNTDILLKAVNEVLDGDFISFQISMLNHVFPAEHARKRENAR